MEPISVALVGIGKIAVDQHVPSITASPDWSLAATVSRNGRVDGVPAFTDLHQMLEAHPEVSVVSLCLPPVPRFDSAAAALKAGRHVMLEKPPGASLAEVHALSRMAVEAGRALFATWHSREARAVAAAAAWLKGRHIQRVHITWHESVRQWHPGQDWVFEPGGMGVFDPGINALSILTRILPEPVFLRSAVLDFPENRDTPIAADLVFSDNVTASFDWREEGPQIWTIDVETNDGALSLRDGGNTLYLDDVLQEGAADIAGEYPALYAHMAELVRTGQSDVDLAPMVHVADAMTLGKRRTVERPDCGLCCRLTRPRQRQLCLL